MKTPEELLSEANAVVAEYAAGAKDSAAKLAEAADTIAALTAEKATAAGIMADLSDRLARAESEASRLAAEAASAELRAAEIIAKSGIDMPLEIKPGADAGSRESVLMDFHSETDPRKKAAIFAKLNNSK